MLIDSSISIPVSRSPIKPSTDYPTIRRLKCLHFAVYVSHHEAKYILTFLVPRTL
jgi:hypothetical protein